MKQCTKCLIPKPERDFFFKDKPSGRLHAQCKQCYKEHRASYYADHYAKNHESYLMRARERRRRLTREYQIEMIRFLQDKNYVICGETDYRVFEFDHINPQDKTFSISQAVRLGHSWKEVKEEIKKCQILCANCHKRRTAEQFGWHKS